jgi:hypothetical protein
MPRTLRNFNELTTIANDDWVHVNEVSDPLDQDKKITRFNLIGTAISGGGAINTGGFTLTVPATGTAALKSGAPVAGRAVRWLDNYRVEDAGFASSDTGRLSVAQSFALLNTFATGISFGQSTLNWYQVGAFTPTLAFGGSSNGLTYAASGQTGRYIRIGTLVNVWVTIRLATVGSSVGNAVVSGLPFASLNINLHRPPLTALATAMTFTGTLGGLCVNNTTDMNLQINNNGALAACTNAAFVNTSALFINFVYECA